MRECGGSGEIKKIQKPGRTPVASKLTKHHRET